MIKPGKKKRYHKPKLNNYGKLIKITTAKTGHGEDALSQISRRT